MIDINVLRAYPEIYAKACEKKRIKFSVPDFLLLDEQYRAAKTSLETSRAEQNRISKAIPLLSSSEKEEQLGKLKEISSKVKELTENFRVLEERWKTDLLRIPQPPLDQVPAGATDADNVPIREWGSIPSFDFVPKDHVEIGNSLGLIDIERGVKVSGARHYFLKSDGVLLQQALHSYALDFLNARGFTLMSPPHLVGYQAMMGTGYFPGGEEMAYQLDDRDKGTFLIGTSEVPLCAYHGDEVFSKSELPKRYAGLSPCYRREAGTYGKDTQGLYRVHQFFKVEQVVICVDDEQQSLIYHEELLTNAEHFLQSLELPYRVVIVCAGDMGQGQVWKHDIECWMPSRKNWGETHSCSSLHAFQARRLNMKYKNDDGKNVFCFTLNNTLVATPRVLIPLIEIHQTSDGKVRIPTVLRPYMGGREFLE